VNDNTLTRRALLRGAAAVTAAAVLPLPALAAEPAMADDAAAALEPPATTGGMIGLSSPTVPAAYPAVDLDSLSEAEHATATAFCWLAAALMTDDEMMAVLAAVYSATETDPNLDFGGLLTAIGGEERMQAIRGRRVTGSLPIEFSDERKAAGVLVGLGFVRDMPADLFDRFHARRLEEMPDLFTA
jgi:hypothetical protein